MSQCASGTGNIQVSVAASQNVTIVVNGQTVVELESRDFPLKLPKTRREIDLLKAPFAQTPLIGRDADLDSFMNWCLAREESLLMRTVVGRGGAGKTRFAYELYARMRQQSGWDAYFLRFNTHEAKGVNLWKEIKSENALIIADYASDGARPLADMLRTLTRLAPAGKRKVRVLLLARTASWDQGWLAGLSSERAGENVRERFDPQEPIELLALSPEGRREVFNRTVAIAAKYMGKPVPPPLPLEQFQKSDVAERLADPLTLMMAALMAVESEPASALALNRTRLAHEVAEKLVAERMKDAVEDHHELFLHMAACATLCGGLQEEEALEALEEESKQTRLGSVDDPAAFLNKLQGWLPGEKAKSWLGVIEPDIVGEAFVLAYLRNADATVLRAAARRSSSAVQAIVRMAQDFSFSETEERVEPLTWLSTLVKRGEADNNFGLLFDLSNALPRSSVILRSIGLEISTILCDRLRDVHSLNANISSEILPLLMSALNTLAIRQREAGRREAALKTVEQAAGHCQELTRRNRDAFLPDLAMVLNNLAAMQGEAGRREAALNTAEEATAAFRELAARSRDAFLPGLAGSLNTLANTQSEAGQRENALATVSESVLFRRELVEHNRDAFLPDLAISLNGLAIMQSEAGQSEAALKTAKEATDLFRELAMRNRDAFLPAWAASLNTLTNNQSDAGQREAALKTAEEAVRLRRELAMRNRDAFLPVWATSLSTLANRQSEAGQREAALRTAEEATPLFRELAERNRDAFLPDWAKLLNNLAVMQSVAGQQEAALKTIGEATLLRRELVERNRDAFLPDLAMSLKNLANMQSEAGQHEEALKTAEEAAGHYQELAQGNRDVFLPDLARLMNDLALTQGEAGQWEKAQITADEAVLQCRELVGRNRNAFLPDLATSLNTLAIQQSEAGQREKALGTAEEAAKLFRELMVHNRDVFLEALAKTCATQGKILTALGRQPEAIKAFEEAIRSVLCGVRKYPTGYLGFCLPLVQFYLSVCEEAKIEPDNNLMQEVITVLGPYLKKEGE